MFLSDKSSRNITISARLHEDIAKYLREKNYPLSEVIEAGILYFLQKEDLEKIEFLVANSIETVKDDILQNENTWEDGITAKYKTENQNPRLILKQLRAARKLDITRKDLEKKRKKEGMLYSPDF